MAYQMIASAAASVLVLSFLLQSGVVDAVGLQGGGCTFRPSRFSDCDLCKPRCIFEGYSTGFCDGRKECMCVECSAHKPPMPLAAAPSGQS
ncbi:hypothetical protein HU200_011362 [Digitaria exilis]|uniref:Defensin n=1 Tax=Digitaria exilis TaxID=1010633 RepID=A0A835FGR6_9POAL|nr:hypothetical protein HU200_011362 [Digitaria exilis]